MSGAFGRLFSPDVRDRGFLMRRRLTAADEIVLPTSIALRINGKSLDQGRTGTCVGHAWKNWSRCEPTRTESKKAPGPFQFYRKAVEIDEWPDNDDEQFLEDGDTGLDFGTSVRAGAEAAVAFGMGKSYVWAFSVQPVLEFIALARIGDRLGGPVVMGTNWYSSMNQTSEGIAKISPTSRVVGGHAYLIRGFNLRRGLALAENSWGDDWGNKGAFWIPLRDLERLIHEDGEACALVETKLKPKAVMPEPVPEEGVD